MGGQGNNEDNYGGDLVRRHGFTAVSPRVYLTVLSALATYIRPHPNPCPIPISDLSTFDINLDSAICTSFSPSFWMTHSVFVRDNQPRLVLAVRYCQCDTGGDLDGSAPRNVAINWRTRNGLDTGTPRFALASFTKFSILKPLTT